MTKSLTKNGWVNVCKHCHQKYHADKKLKRNFFVQKAGDTEKCQMCGTNEERRKVVQVFIGQKGVGKTLAIKKEVEKHKEKKEAQRIHEELSSIPIEP